MRRIRSLARTAALEILSEPLVLLVTAAAMAVAVLAPAFHCHQFGDPTRMARDAGVSALLVGGLVVAGFAGVKAIRSGLENGTILAELSHPVSRASYFLAKFLGLVLAYAFFAVTVGAVSLAMARGAEIGGEIAARQGSLARVYGPVFATALMSVVTPFAAGAFLNRFLRRRFVLAANATALVSALVALGVCFRLATFLRFLPVILLIALPPLVLLAAAAAFSTRFRLNVAAPLALLVFALFAPALGNYCLSDALSDGGSVPWSYVALAALALAPLVAALLALGVRLFDKVDLG